ncbi:hypothetical protein BIW11_02607 [Tropilaelaps mercedesae]|uniref:GON-4-like protein n=1 Tax=Tropilaelaps mercedesae TaxID=418985 RepID=A0A1V9Y0J3_9ACAR|nr:hypothetical protein BIW11_02607 [Tropilaelaps mercedesae]
MSDQQALFDEEDESNHLFIADDLRGDSKDTEGKGDRLSSTPKRSPIRRSRKRKSKDDTASAGGSSKKVRQAAAKSSSRTVDDAPGRVASGSTQLGTEVELEVVQAERQDIDLFLEDTAERNNLTVANVKSILKRIVTNEHVVAMCKRSMSGVNQASDDDDALPFEPKITRAKLRELRAKYPEMEESLIHRYPQVEPNILHKGDLMQLLKEDIAEDEDNDDEEYQPTSDEDVSDDDSEASTSVLHSPMVASPRSAALSAIESPAPVSSSTFRVHSEETIALRTRSKLPLTTEALEQLEANFVAPDITADMYDTDWDCDDDWNKFLRELMQPHGGFRDEEEEDEDPPYNVLEDNEEIDELDLRFDRATKISKTELNELVNELWSIPSGVDGVTHEDTDDEEATFSNSRVPTPPLFNDPPGGGTPAVMMYPNAAIEGLASNRPCSPIGPTACPSVVQSCRQELGFEQVPPLQSAQMSLTSTLAQVPVISSVAIQKLTTPPSIRGDQGEQQPSTVMLNNKEQNQRLGLPADVAEIRCSQQSPSDVQARSNSPAQVRQQDVLGYALSMALNSPTHGQLVSPMKIIIQQGSNPPQEICVEIQQQQPITENLRPPPQNEPLSTTTTTAATARSGKVATPVEQMAKVKSVGASSYAIPVGPAVPSVLVTINEQEAGSMSFVPGNSLSKSDRETAMIITDATGNETTEFALKDARSSDKTGASTPSGNTMADETRRLVEASQPDTNAAVQIIYRDNGLYQTPIEMESKSDTLLNKEGVTYEMSDELWDMIRFVEKRFAYQKNVTKHPEITGFSSDMVERLREQVKMYVQLATQLGMLSLAHPHLQVYGDSNQQTLEALAQLSRVQANPIFEPFNLGPGLQMIEKVRAQLDARKVHPEFVALSDGVIKTENVCLAHPTNDRRTNRKGPGRTAHLRPIPLSLRKMIAWSNVFCFPEILPRVQLVSDLEDYAPTLKTYSKSEDQLIALGLEQFHPGIGYNCPIRTAQLVHTYITPLRRPVQVVDKVRKMMDPDLAPTANPVTYFRAYRSCPPVEWKPRRLMLTPVEQPPYAVPPWVRSFKLSRANKIAVDQLRRSHPPASLAPSKFNSAAKSSSSVISSSSLPPTSGHSKQQTSSAIVNPILKKYKLLPKPNVISVNSGVNKPALSSTPLSKSRKEALLRQMERERDMPEQVISTTNTFTPEGPLEHDSASQNSNTTSPGGGLDLPQSPTSTTIDQLQTGGGSSTSSSNPSDRDSGVSSQFSSMMSLSSNAENIPQKLYINSVDPARQTTVSATSVDVNMNPGSETATADRVNKSTPADTDKIPTKQKNGLVGGAVRGGDEDSGALSAIAADAGEAEQDVETEADNIQEQLDALMAASSKISRNTLKCPRKHRQLIRDLEATLPLLDTQQLVEDNERENQFILNYVAKAKKFLDHDKVLEMVAVLRKYKDNVKELFVKLDDTLSSCPALVEELVLFLDSEQAFVAGRFQQHLALAKMRLFLRKTEIHSGSPALAHRLLKALKNCVKTSSTSTGASGLQQAGMASTGSTLAGQTCGTISGSLTASGCGSGGAFSSISGIAASTSGSPVDAARSVSEADQEDDQLATQVVAVVTPLLRGQPHLLEEFLALFPNQRVETSRMTDFDEVVLLGEDPPLVASGRGGSSQGADTSSGDADIVEVVRLPPSPEPIGGRRCPCKCHQTNIPPNAGAHHHTSQHSGACSAGSIVQHHGLGTTGALGTGLQKGPAEEHHKLANRDRHCLECAIRFVDGKVFLQTGKTMKPAAVRFVEEFPEEEEQPKENSAAKDKKDKGGKVETNHTNCSASSLEQGADGRSQDKPPHKVVPSIVATEATTFVDSGFWTRERDGILLSLWQAKNGDADACCTEAFHTIGVSKEDAQKRLAFLMSVYSSYLTQSRQQQSQLSQLKG